MKNIYKKLAFLHANVFYLAQLKMIRVSLAEHAALGPGLNVMVIHLIVDKSQRWWCDQVKLGILLSEFIYLVNINPTFCAHEVDSSHFSGDPF